MLIEDDGGDLGLSDEQLESVAGGAVFLQPVSL